MTYVPIILRAALGVSIIATILIVAESWAAKHFQPPRFQAGVQRQIYVKRPHVIFIGNSMLGVNIDRRIVERELSSAAERPIKALFIYAPSMHSGWSYLVIKNQIARAAREGTPIVLLDFEDFFVRPSAGVGTSRRSIRTLRSHMTADELTFFSKAGRNAAYLRDGTPSIFYQRLHIKRWIAYRFTEHFLRIFINLSTIHPRHFQEDNDDDLTWLFETVFRGARFRSGQLDARERVDRHLNTGASPEDFTALAEGSFLPDILKFHQTFPLYFVLSNTAGSMEQIKADLPVFAERLGSYLTERGAAFIDMNENAAVQDPDLMSDSRHYKKGNGQRVASRELVRELIAKGILEDILKK